MTQRPEDMRPAWEIAPEVVDAMIEDYLCGESSHVVAARHNCSHSIPPIKAFKRGFITHRCYIAHPDIITPAGLAWLKARERDVTKRIHEIERGMARA